MDAFSVVMAVIGIGAVILVVLVIRGVFLWYFRVDDIIKRQDEIINQLKQINQNAAMRNPLSPPPPSRPPTP